MSRPSPQALAKIAARSMCPTCEGREPGPGEEAYASCFFCAFETPDATVTPLAVKAPRHPAEPPRTRTA